ncbi:MAG: Gfo/Idh/MocA family oxidoreductase [Campylobacterales bacterium]|nr:Gfo/Idh/MocA family oxidoreductase [Campylobacterales bacterium]
MLNVALIGIGNIGLLYDKKKSDRSKALSHVKAIYLHKQFTLKYVVDIKKTHFYTIKNFFPNAIFNTDYKSLLKKNDIDILVVATPTFTHYTIINEFEKYNKNIKVIFSEKPLFETSDEYQSYKQKNQNKLIVNYLRRFDKNIQNLKKEIRTTQFGKIQKIVINYCKGLKNNGSHMIDMINFLFENPKIISTQILCSTIGFNCNDLTYDIFIELEYNNATVPVYFLGFDHTLYNMIEHNIYFENKLVKYINSKSVIEYYDIVPDKNFHQYKVTSHLPTIKKVITTRLMYNTYDTIYKQINKKTNHISSYKDEIANYKFLEQILKGSSCQN